MRSPVTAALLLGLAFEPALLAKLVSAADPSGIKKNGSIEWTMARSDLIQCMAMRNPTLSATNIAKMLDAIFEAIADHLAKDGRVELRGFGAFSTRLRAARPGVNPRTGERVALGDKRLVYFRPGKQMHEAINADVGTTKAAGRSRPPSQVVRVD